MMDQNSLHRTTITVYRSISLFTSEEDLVSDLSCLLHKTTTGLYLSSEEETAFSSSCLASNKSSLLELLSTTKIYSVMKKDCMKFKTIIIHQISSLFSKICKQSFTQYSSFLTKLHPQLINYSCTSGVHNISTL